MFFQYPKLLYLLLLLIPMVLLYVWREIKGKHPYLNVPSITPWSSGGKNSSKKLLRHVPFVLRCLAVAALILAVARPKSSTMFERTSSEGIDIVLDIDVSSSMLAMDFKPDRIGAAKDIAVQFISQRPADRMGLVVFAGESYTQCPLTTDRATLINLLKDIQVGIIDDGTAIGNGLATAVSRLNNSDAKSRVIILLTDGVNNAGEVSPSMAADLAQTYGIRVYTIGVGAMGQAPYPFPGYGIQNIPVEIDEPLLKEIAEKTGGKYFRATDNTKLIEIYSEINKMEKSITHSEAFAQYKELFMLFALAAFVAVVLEIIFKLFITKHLPD